MRKVHVMSFIRPSGSRGKVLLIRKGGLSGRKIRKNRVEQPPGERVHLSPFLDTSRALKRRDYFLPMKTTTTARRGKDVVFQRIKIFFRCLPVPFLPPIFLSTTPRGLRGLLSLAKITAQTCSGRLVRIDSFLWHFPPFPHTLPPSPP